ncbi:MAG: VacJ family lipoprotein [Verrucomicrobia bacterium]|nr:VacJ family lipoprotein [Verrucomicrobiota bacterium]
MSRFAPRLLPFLLTLACLASVVSLQAQSGFYSPRSLKEKSGAPTVQDDYDDYAAPVISDPFESFNRAVFTFNDRAYTYVLTPFSKGYETIVRPPVNRSIANFYDNVRYPVRLVNSLLQGKFKRAGLETQKFYVNTVAGLGGFIRQSDTIPALARIPREDFGQTLGVWGVPHGPYIVVPILGGYSLRDLAGRASDTVVSPSGWQYIDFADHRWVGELSWQWQTTIAVTDTMSTLPSVLDLYAQMKKAAVDPYLSVRDGFRRYRDAETAK